MCFRIIFVSAILTSGLLAAEPAPKPLKPGTYYSSAEAGIEKMELKGTTLHVTFRPKAESFYWCPGIRRKATKKAVIITFVRCSVLKDCGVDQKAEIGKKLIRSLVIDTKGLDVYAYEGGKKFKRIHQAPKKKKTKKTPKK